jgi:hypothetical protein
VNRTKRMRFHAIKAAAYYQHAAWLTVRGDVKEADAYWRLSEVHKTRAARAYSAG